MPSSLAEVSPKPLGKSRPRKKRLKPLSKKPPRVASKSQRLDAATLASKLQLQEQQRELIYGVISLVMKFGLLLIGTTSLIKLGISSHQRIGRYSELSSVLRVESGKLIGLKSRFDRFFTIGGDRRFMDENDQWIAPNRRRIIWR